MILHYRHFMHLQGSINNIIFFYNKFINFFCISCPTTVFEFIITIENIVIFNRAIVLRKVESNPPTRDISIFILNFNWRVILIFWILISLMIDETKIVWSCQLINFIFYPVSQYKRGLLILFVNFKLNSVNQRKIFYYLRSPIWIG